MFNCFLNQILSAANPHWRFTSLHFTVRSDTNTIDQWTLSITKIRIDQYEIVYRNKIFTAQQSDIFELEILCIFLVSVCAAIPGPQTGVNGVSRISAEHLRNEKEKNYSELIFGSLMMVWYVMANRIYRTRLRALILYYSSSWWMVYIVPLLVHSFCIHFHRFGKIENVANRQSLSVSANYFIIYWWMGIDIYYFCRAVCRKKNIKMLNRKCF